MEDSENGTPDDVVFNDEGSFYDPDERVESQAEERAPEERERSFDENGDAEASVGAASQEGRQYDDRVGDERHPRRRRRRRRRSRRGGGGGGGDYQRGGQPQGQRQQRRGGGDQNGMYDQPEREG